MILLLNYTLFSPKPDISSNTQCPSLDTTCRHGRHQLITALSSQPVSRRTCKRAFRGCMIKQARHQQKSCAPTICIRQSTQARRLTHPTHPYICTAPLSRSLLTSRPPRQQSSGRCTPWPTPSAPHQSEPRWETSRRGRSSWQSCRPPSQHRHRQQPCAPSPCCGR